MVVWEGPKKDDIIYEQSFCLTSLTELIYSRKCCDPKLTKLMFIVAYSPVFISPHITQLNTREVKPAPQIDSCVSTD